MTNYIVGTIAHFFTWVAPLWLLAIMLCKLFGQKVSKQKVIGLSVAACFGYIYMVSVRLWFTFTPEYNPLFNWLLENTQMPWFRPLVTAQDLLQQFMIALPFAWLLLRLKPTHPILYLLLFLLPALLSSYSHLILNFAAVEDWSIYIPGIIFELTVFPIAYVSLYKLKFYWASRSREK